MIEFQEGVAVLAPSVPEVQERSPWARWDLHLKEQNGSSAPMGSWFPGEKQMSEPDMATGSSQIHKLGILVHHPFSSSPGELGKERLEAVIVFA